VIIDRRNPYSITFTPPVTSRAALRTSTDYLYERREKVTSIPGKKIVKVLQTGEELYQILKTDAFYTNSVQTNMDKIKVHVTCEDNFPLPNPQCFTYTIASKGHHKMLN
jgi:hypothetical protein